MATLTAIPPEGQRRRHPLLNDPQWLHKRYLDERLSCSAIGELVGTSASVVHRALVRQGIATRKRRMAAPVIPADQLHELYVEKGLTYAEIGSLVDCCESTVCLMMRDAGIQPRSLSAAQRRRRQLERVRLHDDAAERAIALDRLISLSHDPSLSAPEQLRASLAAVRDAGYTFTEAFDAAVTIAIDGRPFSRHWHAALAGTRREWHRSYERIGPRIQIDAAMIAPRDTTGRRDSQLLG